MNDRVLYVEQGSADWLQAKCGVLSSSRIAGAIAKFKSEKKAAEEMACRRNLKFELISERLTGNVLDHYVSVWMKEGKENEPLARAAYEDEMGVMCDLVGFVYHPRLKWAGCSPDSLTGSDGMQEYKCPKVTTHLAWIKGGVIPEEYVPQMRWQLACCPERKWNDFCSYCPSLPKDCQTFIVRMLRNDKKIAAMEAEAEVFLTEVETETEEIRKKNKIFLTDGLLEKLEESLDSAKDRESFGADMAGKGKL